MDVKIDTKEKFTVFTPQDAEMSVIMAENLRNQLHFYHEKEVPHVVLNLKNLTTIESSAAQLITSIQSEFYEKGHSFVICEMHEQVSSVFETEDLLDIMNITPSESEAWDIVQMEEIERELMNNFDDSTGE